MWTDSSAFSAGKDLDWAGCILVFKNSVRTPQKNFEIRRFKFQIMWCVCVCVCVYTLLFFERVNRLKTKPISFILGLSAYRAVNTLHFGYKNPSLNVL
jgi:cell division protein FtsW (lipid II flippase)